MNEKPLGDQELVQAVLTRYDFTHQQLADWLTISRVAVTKMANGQTALRVAVRRKLEQMMDSPILREDADQDVAEQGIHVK